MNADQQNDFIDLVKLRLNQMNPYDDPEVQFSFPFERIPFGPALSDWTVMTLDEFENGGRLMLPIKVPILSGT